MIPRRGVCLLSWVGLGASVVLAEWTERPDLTAAYRTYRTDVEFRFSGKGAYLLSCPWQPMLRWDSTNRMTHVGALDRNKRDASLRARLELEPSSWCSVDFVTDGWRRRDVATEVLERARGAAAEVEVTVSGVRGARLTQALGTIRDRVASVALGEEQDNGGSKAHTQLTLSRSWAGRTCDVSFLRTWKDVRLDGTDNRTASLHLGSLPGDASFEVHSNQRRYRTGSIEESRTERGESVRLKGRMGNVASWEYGGASSASSYREGTSQDFSNTSSDFRVEFAPPIGPVKPSIKATLSRRVYDEEDRTIYDREDAGRAVEAAVAVIPPDSTLSLRVTHSISLDQNTYADPSNYSDHDIRDQRIVADFDWRPGAASYGVTLTRRRSDLVYVDAERSANTVKNTDYSASFAYSFPLRYARWSQSYFISARYAQYRFRPESDALSRRGTVESTLTALRGRYEAEVFQRWLWDDNGPFLHQRFQRLELTEDVEFGVRGKVTSNGWSIGPGIRQRWRFVYGPEGRGGELARPTQVERRATLDVRVPLGTRGLSVAATRVHTGNSSHWEATAEVGNAW